MDTTVKQIAAIRILWLSLSIIGRQLEGLTWGKFQTASKRFEISIITSQPLFKGYLKSLLGPQEPQNLTEKPQICLTLKNMPIFCCRACKSVTLGMTSQSFGHNMTSHGHNMASIGHKLFFVSWILVKGTSAKRPSWDLNTSPRDSLGFSPRHSLDQLQYYFLQKSVILIILLTYKLGGVRISLSAAPETKNSKARARPG